MNRRNLFFVFVVLFVVSCQNDVTYLRVKWDQIGHIEELSMLSGYVHGYKYADRDGRMFGSRYDFNNNIFYIIAAMFSGRSIFPYTDYTYSLVFPICARGDPAFLAMVEDLRNPQRFIEGLGDGYQPPPKHARHYAHARRYFLGPTDGVKDVEIIFKDDCVEKYYYSEGDVVVDSMKIQIPISNTYSDM